MIVVIAYFRPMLVLANRQKNVTHANQGLKETTIFSLVSGRFIIAHRFFPPSLRGCSFFCAAKELSNADSLLVGTKPFVSARRPEAIGESCFAWFLERTMIPLCVRHRTNSSAFFRSTILLASAV